MIASRAPTDAITPRNMAVSFNCFVSRYVENATIAETIINIEPTSTSHSAAGLKTMLNKYNAWDMSNYNGKPSPATDILNRTHFFIHGILDSYPDINPREIESLMMSCIFGVVSEQVLRNAMNMRKSEKENKVSD